MVSHTVISLFISLIGIVAAVPTTTTRVLMHQPTPRNTGIPKAAVMTIWNTETGEHWDSYRTDHVEAPWVRGEDYRACIQLEPDSPDAELNLALIEVPASEATQTSMPGLSPAGHA